MRFPHVVLLSACALMWTATLLAQSPNGVINGLVVDPSNKVIGEANILIINDATGVKYSGKTNDDGIYVVPNLPPGSYRLQVSKVGFKTLIKPDIVLNIQDALSINFTLPIGAVFEIVTVEGGASMVNTTDASVSTVVDQTYVKNMPLNGRSFQDLILLTPGIVTQTPQNVNSGLGQTGEFSVNGQRPEENYYTVDGVSANVGGAAGFNMYFYAGASGSLPGATALGTTQALVSVDDLQEFRVQSSTYSAEYGRNPGGQFAFETKSGTNQWHGGAYDYLRNGALDANDWFNNYFSLQEPDLRQNDFGGTIGGPFEVPALYHGKGRSFFFVSYEGLRLAAPQAATVTYVPDAALRASAPTALQPALNAYPVSNGPDVGGGIAEYIGNWSNPASLDSTSIRFDHTVSERLKLFFRFSDTSSQSTSRGTSYGDVPTVQSTPHFIVRTYTGGVIAFLSKRMSNDFRLNYSSNQVSDPFVLNSLGGSTPVNLAQLADLSEGSDISFSLDYGGYSPALEQQLQTGAQRQWNLLDTFELSSGRHQLKFGVDYRRLAPFAIVATPYLSYYYFSESAVETNNSFTFPAAYGPAYPLYRNFSAFAQDEWRLNQRLSVSGGLRWEVNPAPGVTQGLKPYTIQGAAPTTWELAPQGTSLWNTTWFNFAPRLGAAFIVNNTPGWETVVRSGGGVFFDTGQQVGSQGFNGPGFIQYGSFLPGSFPVVPSIPTIANPPSPPFGFAYGFATHLQLPYTLQWNASMEQALGRSQALTATYVGAHASRLLREDAIVPSSSPILTSGGNFYFYDNGLTSDYDSMQLQYRRKLSQGLTTLASYTWSHCIDYGSQNYYYGHYQRGNCDFDVRSNLSAAFSYDVPNVGHDGFLRALLDHLGVDNRITARTSFPVTLNGTLAVDPQSGKQYYEGLNLIPGEPVYLHGTQCADVYATLYGNTLPCPGGRAINPNAFVSVTSGSGGAPRNFVRGFGAWQLDAAIHREFPIYENLRLQFRAEGFNIFNHPSFGTVNPNIGQNTFGQATATLASS
ncbi:MAG: carboxypeptidase regulatory-like domain-containing protein, partial [Candidatus Sulfotelmatobacter sp.]